MDSSKVTHSAGARKAAGIAEHQGTSDVKLYSAWFCPFAQRAWVALEARHVPYQYIEVDPYAKPPELMNVNPRGLVPAIDDKGKPVYESMVCLEYVDEAFTDKQQPEHSLLPEDAHLRAVARIWMDHINKKVVPTFYRVLQRQEKEEQEAAKEDLLGALRELSQAMSTISQDGPFFMGSKFGAVDITLAPWVPLRTFVLRHFRAFEIPQDADLARLHKWIAAVESHPAVVRTKADEAELLKTYQRYADNTAQSQVALAVNSNKPLP